MKKFYIILFVMIFGITACGKKGAVAPTQSPAPAAQEAANVEEYVPPQEDIITEETVLGDYTSEFLMKYVESGTYYISQNTTVNGETTNVAIAVSGQKSAEKIGTQVKIVDGDKFYYVIHDSKLVLTATAADEMKEGFTDFISVKTSAEAKNSLQNTGEEEINGTKYGFEEFKSEAGIISKFYYDDVTLRYVKITDANGREELIEVLAISSTVPEDIFSVPSDYVSKELSEMQ